MLPLPLNRERLRPAGAGSGELAGGLEVRWLRARLRGYDVMFDELEPRTSPKKWKPAQPAAASQAESALRAAIGRHSGQRKEESNGRRRVSAHELGG
jgi:hypothetical protein